MKKCTYVNNWEQWENEFSFFHEVKVRFSETDMFGHLNNTVPIVYFEAARISYMEHIGLMQEWLAKESKAIPVVADIQCDFLRQVYFGDELKIYVKADSIGNSSCDIHYKGINKEGEICFTGRGTVVQICRSTGGSLPLTEDMKRRLSEEKQLVKLR